MTATASMTPLAELLLALADARLLAGKPEIMTPDVPPAWRCAACHHRSTRLKLLGFVPRGLGPIEGIEARCRVCGATNVFRVDQLEAAA